MTHADAAFDVVVVGSGPAGMGAALQAAQGGWRVLMVEQERGVGGVSVHRGTLRSNTLRETALALWEASRKTGQGRTVADSGVPFSSLLARVQAVTRAHTAENQALLDQARVESWHGRARFADPHAVEVERLDGTLRRASGRHVVIATGSRPAGRAGVAVDHQSVLDLDSVLAMDALPESLTVLGSGVRACEYASVFAALGVEVTLLDRGARPLAFLDEDLGQAFVHSLESMGGRFRPRSQVERLWADGVGTVVTQLAGGKVVCSEKALLAQGRVANVERLQLAQAGLELSDRGHLTVNPHLQTAVDHIYAVGDVIGPPALAASAMAQGRRAMEHAQGLVPRMPRELVPAAVHTIPEMASVGLTEAQARGRFPTVRVGRAPFSRLTRGHLAACTEGFIKLVADGDDKVLGVHVAGEGAVELVHVGQMAMVNGRSVDVFVDNVFSFPTLAEGYRLAALDLVAQVR